MSMLFWGMTACSLVDIHRRFGGTFCIHLMSADVEYPPHRTVFLRGLAIGRVAREVWKIGTSITSRERFQLTVA
jgi:hypothetical protein